MKKDKKRKNEKKGEMTTGVIISIIILVISFFIILSGFMSIDWTGNINKETCHKSVILRASLPSIDSFGKKIVETPLDCKTEKICITTNKLFKGDCEDDFGNKDYTTIRIISDSKSGKQQEEIKQILANAMYECWSMMGEGKISVFSKSNDWNIGTNDNKKCSICTRIAFDKSLKETKEGIPTDIKINGFFNYLLKTKIPEKQITYWQYLTNSYETPSYLPEFVQNDSLTLNQKMIVFSEMQHSALINMLDTSSSVTSALAGGKIGLGLGSLVPFPPGMSIIGGIAGAGIGYFSYNLIRDNIKIDGLDLDAVEGRSIQSVSIRDYDSENLAALNCKSFENKV